MHLALSIPSLLVPGIRQAQAVKSLVQLIVFVLLSGPAVLPTQAVFSSLYAFGDGVCTTTDNVDWDPSYYPMTYSNGRIWIQVLAQRQGLAYDGNKNLSYFGHGSADLVNDLNSFTAPTNVNTALFVVWVNDADFANYMLNTYPTYGLDPAKWNSMVSSSLANHQTAITKLYAKGALTLIMPNAVDLTKIPQYVNMAAGEKSFIRQGISDFNTSFATLLNQAMASQPSLKIYMPDMFGLQDNMVAHPGDYGLVNATGGIYAIQDGYSTWNGPRNNWLWWDPWDPTAKAHEIMADTVQQLLSPATISKVISLNGSNRLDVVNYPSGLGGYVDGRTNLPYGSWTLNLTNFTSTNVTQSIFVRTSGPQQSYRLRFPFAWSWP
jgi:hypothetical protein